MLRLLRWLLGVATAAATPLARADAPMPPPPSSVARAVVLVEIAHGLDHPVALVIAPDDPQARLFIVEQSGRVRILGAPALAAPFLDLTSRLSHGTEQGLLGLTFHPRFRQNGRLFVYYTDRRGDIHLVEFRVAESGSQVDATTERELLVVPHHDFTNHNGGEVLFGPDGKLYLGFGDGGFHGDPNGNGQNPKTLLAKIVRLDVDTAAAKPQIVAKGVRNPWRFSFDHATGDLYIADVGQDSYEEINVVPAGTLDGRNFGWNFMEGLHCVRGTFCEKAAFTRPILEYTHKIGCSVTGGYVYRGHTLPELDGMYFYADYCTAFLRSFRYQDGRAVDEWDWKHILDPSSKLAQISSFGEDAAGELYLLSLEGTIYKFVRSHR